jgi:hypothetical protein
MQIASSDERITINSARLADLNEYMLINSVPYLKENNSPIPFNVISLHTSNSVNAYGFKGCNLYNKYSDRISSSRASGRCNYSSVIVDNVNPNMIHCFDLTGGTLNAQKLIINEDKTISLLSKNTIASYTTDSVGYDVPFPSYITQDNDYIYALISLGKTKTDISAGATSSTGYTNGGTTSFSTLPYVYKIRKNDYEYYDYIIAMDESNIEDIESIVGYDKNNKIKRLLDFTNNPRNIKDPWYTGNFDETFDDVVEGCQALLEQLSSEI